MIELYSKLTPTESSHRKFWDELEKIRREVSVDKQTDNTKPSAGAPAHESRPESRISR